MAGHGERRSMDARKGESSEHLCDRSLATRLADLARSSHHEIGERSAELTGLA